MPKDSGDSVELSVLAQAAIKAGADVPEIATALSDNASLAASKAVGVRKPTQRGMLTSAFGISARLIGLIMVVLLALPAIGVEDPWDFGFAKEFDFGTMAYITPWLPTMLQVLGIRFSIRYMGVFCTLAESFEAYAMTVALCGFTIESVVFGAIVCSTSLLHTLLVSQLSKQNIYLSPYTTRQVVMRSVICTFVSFVVCAVAIFATPSDQRAWQTYAKVGVMVGLLWEASILSLVNPGPAIGVCGGIPLIFMAMKTIPLFADPIMLAILAGLLVNFVIVNHNIQGRGISASTLEFARAFRRSTKGGFVGYLLTTGVFLLALRSGPIMAISEVALSEVAVFLDDLTVIAARVALQIRGNGILAEAIVGVIPEVASASDQIFGSLASVHPIVHDAALIGSKEVSFGTSTVENVLAGCCLLAACILYLAGRGGGSMYTLRNILVTLVFAILVALPLAELDPTLTLKVLFGKASVNFEKAGVAALTSGAILVAGLFSEIIYSAYLDGSNYISVNIFRKRIGRHGATARWPGIVLMLAALMMLITSIAMAVEGAPITGVFKAPSQSTAPPWDGSGVYHGVVVPSALKLELTVALTKAVGKLGGRQAKLVLLALQFMDLDLILDALKVGGKSIDDLATEIVAAIAEVALKAYDGVSEVDMQILTDAIPKLTSIGLLNPVGLRGLGLRELLPDVPEVIINISGYMLAAAVGIAVLAGFLAVAAAVSPMADKVMDPFTCMVMGGVVTAVIKLWQIRAIVALAVSGIDVTFTTWGVLFAISVALFVVGAAANTFFPDEERQEATRLRAATAGSTMVSNPMGHTDFNSRDADYVINVEEDSGEDSESSIDW